MRSLKLAAMALAPAVALCACSSVSSGIGSVAGRSVGGSTRGSAASSTTASRQPPASVSLLQQLLKVSDLPAGWAVDNSSSSGGVTTPPCLANLKSTLHTPDRAEADFIDGVDVPGLQQTIGAYASSAAAAMKFAAGAAILNACRDLSFESNGTHVTGSIGQLSLATLGEQSQAWQVVLTAQGQTLGLDLVLVSQGSELEMVVYADLDTPDLDIFTSFAREAVRKMPTH